jgi:hypothetical protein
MMFTVYSVFNQYKAQKRSRPWRTLAIAWHYHGNRACRYRMRPQYKACLFPLLVTTHQELGGSTSTLHHRTGEIEEWTLHHRTGENHHPGPEERAEDTTRTLPSQTSKLNLLFGADAPYLLLRRRAKSTPAPARRIYCASAPNLLLPQRTESTLAPACRICFGAGAPN